MALSYDEMQQLFEQMGFKGFSMRAYDAQMEYLISEAMEDNAKAYMIDVVPGDLEFGQNDGIALLEKHYYKEANMARLLRKWLDIVLHFSCYYPLETVLVTGVGLPDIEDFKEQTPNVLPVSESPVITFKPLSKVKTASFFPTPERVSFVSIILFIANTLVLSHKVLVHIYLSDKPC